MEARRKIEADDDGPGALPAQFDVQGANVVVVARNAAGRTLIAAFARAIADRPETRSVWGDTSRLYVQLELRAGVDAWAIVIACVESTGADRSLVRPPRKSLGWA